MNFCNSARQFIPGRPLAALLISLTLCPALAAERVMLNFNPDWKFIKDDPAGAQAPGFDDRSWSDVSAPHTYNDTDTFDNWSIRGHRGEQDQWGGRTWYRKTFTVPEAWEGKKVFIEFEAVRQFAEVYLNGQLLGISRNGFAPFGFDLTPHVKFGRTNVLAVMCDNRFMIDPGSRRPANTGNANRAPDQGAHLEAPPPRQVASNDFNIAPPAGSHLAAMQAHVNAMIPDDINEIQPDQLPWNNPHWHPAHGGIYRNVRLYVTDPLHITLPLYSFLETEGPYVYATDVSEKTATITMEVPVENGRNRSVTAEVVAEVLDRNNRVVLTGRQSAEIAPGAKSEFKLSGALTNPQRWEPAYPYLYTVAFEVKVGRDVVDTFQVPLGIRDVKWTVDQGFFINGRHLKLRGWGQKSTDGWPGLGAAQPDWMHFYTLQLMKEAGGNFVRWGHTLGGPAHVKAADALGLITLQPGVDGEADTRGAAWAIRAATFRDTIIYFRNNPSILIWEGGNQKVSREHGAELRGYMDKYDPHGNRTYAHRRSDQIVAEFMDVCIGTEGGREIRSLPVVEGEYNREESPRRVWDHHSPPNFGYPEAVGNSDYVLTSEEFAVNQILHYMKKISALDHSGGANWIFSDGTHGGRNAAEVARASGEVDGVRLPKEAYYVCEVIFSPDPQVHIIGHWTYAEGTKKPIYVASNAEEVELFVNRKSLGRAQPTDRYLFTFPDVVWEAGEISAAAYRNGKVVARQTKRTAGEPVALRMTPITAPGGLRADGSDVLLIDVEAVDRRGERVPTFQQRVDFTTSGPGIWRGGYNSGKTNSINHPYLDLEAGVNRVAVRSKQEAGRITVTATTPGLKDAKVSVRSRPVRVQHGAMRQMPPMPEVKLSRQALEQVDLLSAATVQTAAQAQSGRFVRSLSYSGPTSGIRIEQGVENGKKIYADADLTFGSLPRRLNGADYVQALHADRTYNAVDLMELAVRGGSTVYVAHDNRLERPDWLTRQFQPSNLSLDVNGHPMSVFTHRAEADQSLTLGTNTENASARESNMYIVFVNER